MNTSNIAIVGKWLRIKQNKTPDYVVIQKESISVGRALFLIDQTLEFYRNVIN